MVPTIFHPAALWLMPVALALLLAFRLLRARRKTVLVGSLLIWRRLSALPIKTKPKRIIFDASLWLQAGALLALIAALAHPMLQPPSQRGRTTLLLLDNGPLARARNADGKTAFEMIRSNALRQLKSFAAEDRFFIARSAPLPAVLNDTRITANEAAAQIAQISPALSGPDAAALRIFAADRARALAPNDAIRSIVVSLQSNPGLAALQNSDLLWLCAAEKNIRFDNVGIVAAGSISVANVEKPGERILVRLENFSDQAVEGSVILEGIFTNSDLKPMLHIARGPIKIGPHAEAVTDFRVDENVKAALRITWKSTHNQDALPEDDVIVLAPQPTHAPRIRFHAPLPALEKLFKIALDAEILAGDSTKNTSAADLDIYVRNVPDKLPDESKAALFVAPEKGYRNFFDIGPNLLKWPKARRDADDPLTAGIAAGDSAQIAIPQALEILRTGDFKVLLLDTVSNRALAASFLDEHARPCWALAFVPGENLPTERLLDPPLAAFFMRMALHAAQSGPPYGAVKAETIERADNKPLPLNWTPQAEPDSAGGVLSERASNLSPGIADHEAQAKAQRLFFRAQGLHEGESRDGLPWLAAVAMLCALAEFFISTK